MTSGYIHFEDVSFRYDTMPDLMLQSFNAGIGKGWMGIVGPNGSGKTTLLRLACGQLEPTQGRVRRPDTAVYCPQRTDAPPELFTRFLASTNSFSAAIRSCLGLREDWSERWQTLSHGERKRAQIATALWRQPGILALDEPTNHIDADARGLLIAELQRFRGIGLLVSHDRALLDALCGRCIFLDPPNAMLRPGGYSDGRKEALREEAQARSEKERAAQRAGHLASEALRRRTQARQSESKHFKNNLALRDHDGRARIDRARLSGADGRAGKLARQSAVRAEKALKTMREIKVRKRYETGIRIEGAQCGRDTLFRLAAGSLTIAQNRQLQHPDLILRPGDRIALTGSNGAGKSSLIRTIVGALEIPADRLTYIPQEIATEAARQILADARRQTPAALGKIMTGVRRLGSNPEALLHSNEPSPGELRKLLLGIGLALQPWLIVMDEPTNHLDLPSIECLEEALAECRCGLLLASHDHRFLERLTYIHWRITPLETGGMLQINDAG